MLKLNAAVLHLEDLQELLDVLSAQSEQVTAAAGQASFEEAKDLLETKPAERRTLTVTTDRPSLQVYLSETSAFVSLRPDDKSRLLGLKVSSWFEQHKPDNLTMWGLALRISGPTWWLVFFTALIDFGVGLGVIGDLPTALLFSREEAC